MASKDKLVPRNPNEVVVPVGKAKLVTTPEEIDNALKAAGNIFRKKNDDDEEKNMDNENVLNEELETSLDVNAEADPDATGTSDDVELVELSADELAALPHAKFGRDKYGRALNKDKTPRKARNDKGIKRGAYGPRKPKAVPTEENATPAPVAEAAANAGSE